jgi:uncharacterized membrane-anchored protein YjiN (DUF445 family)
VVAERLMMDSDQLSQELESLGLTAIGFARLIKELGDPSDISAIDRRIRRWTKGEASVSGEAIALLTMLKRIRTASAEISSLVSQPPQKKKRPSRKRPAQSLSQTSIPECQSGN